MKKVILVVLCLKLGIEICEEMYQDVQVMYNV